MALVASRARCGCVRRGFEALCVCIDLAHGAAGRRAEAHEVRVVALAELIDKLQPQQPCDELVERCVRLRAHEDAPAAHDPARAAAAAAAVALQRRGAREAVGDRGEQAAVAGRRRGRRRTRAAGLRGRVAHREAAQHILKVLLRGGVVQHVEQRAQ